MKILCVSIFFHIVFYDSYFNDAKYNILFTLIVASYTEGNAGTCNIADSDKCEATETVSRYTREGIPNV